MKTCLITGASGGIGQQVAKQLAEDGYQLILHFQRNREAIDQLMQTLPDGSVLQLVQADLRQERDVHHMMDSLSFSVDTVVFASGISLVELFQDVRAQDMEDMLAIHVKAPWMITQRVLPSMISKKNGNIIVISSIWGEVGASCEVIYSSVKGAQDSFVKALAKEVGPSGVRVNGIRPGFIQTNMNQLFTEEERNEIVSEIPLGRLGTPLDVADAVSFLVSEKASYIQGQLLNVNGAWSG